MPLASQEMQLKAQGATAWCFLNLGWKEAVGKAVEQWEVSRAAAVAAGGPLGVTVCCSHEEYTQVSFEPANPLLRIYLRDWSIPESVCPENLVHRRPWPHRSQQSSRGNSQSPSADAWVNRSARAYKGMFCGKSNEVPGHEKTAVNPQ